MQIRRLYYGEYRSSTAGLTGCTKAFVTTASDVLLFPPQVEYPCDVCSVTHGFRLVTTHQTTTPSQVRNFAAHCAAHGIEQGVSVGRR